MTKNYHEELINLSTYSIPKTAQQFKWNREKCEQNLPMVIQF